MKRAWLVSVVFLSLSLAAPGGEELRAAIAVRVVTPDPLLPVSGGVGPSTPATELEGELNVRALVFESGETRVAFVSTDFLGFPAVLGERVRERVSSVPAEHILIGATHTHSAPDCYGFPDGKGGTDADMEYLDGVCDKIASAIEEAASSLEPVSVRIATAKVAEGIAYNYYAPELYDRRCSVIQAVATDGEPLATLVNYAIHPEVLGSKRGVLSPDLVGPLYERIEAAGGGKGIFMNGAQGGMITADTRGPHPEGTEPWDECVRIGHLLADEALRIVAKARPNKDPELRCHWREVDFPVDSPILRTIINASPLGIADGDGSSLRARINLVELGDARILTIPGEALPNIGYYLKRKLGGRHNLLFGLTNEAFGYILTKEDWFSFDRYDYVSRTCLGERTGEILIRESLALVEEAAGR
ncbi:MAG: hypothetical protein CMJ84_02540 [Planctomycetes bacterium]|jgi:hypothetical protein|nr:hypothetical protein [Planctomycetota bacterium]MDP6408383.1 hypothetical protein [Planctomycetota bacterium]